MPPPLTLPRREVEFGGPRCALPLTSARRAATLCCVQSSLPEAREMKLFSMQHLAAAIAAGFLALAGFASAPAEAANVFDNFSFPMVPTGGVEACVKKAKGVVTVSPTFGLVENMQVAVSGLPPNTNFDLFVTQVPASPFGLAWYLGALTTDSTGTAVGTFIGRFSIGTFTVALGVAVAPKVLPDDATKNPVTAPVQLYHLGLWFDSPRDAGRAGCGTAVTPFNSTHNAGVQVLNTSNFSDLNRPLRHVDDR
jgi:hypothetical protein